MTNYILKIGTGQSPGLENQTLPATAGSFQVTGASAIIAPPGDEPVFNSLTDTLIYPIGVSDSGYEVGFDDFDNISDPGGRYGELLRLRSLQGNAHDIFVSDGRKTEADPNGYSVISPGRDGSGFALRASFVQTPNNQQVQWLTWPEAQTAYTPATATVVWQMYLRISTGWEPASAGLKFMEWWHTGDNGRSQLSIWKATPKWSMQWGSHPSGSPYNQPYDGQNPSLSQSQLWPNDGAWHRFTWLYTPKTTLLDTTTGAVQLWIDGALTFDISAAGVTNGWCSLTAFKSISHLAFTHHKFPDVLNASDSAGTIDYDDLTWWKVG